MMISPTSDEGVAVRAALASPTGSPTLLSPSPSSPSSPPAQRSLDSPRLRPRRRPSRAQSVQLSSSVVDNALRASTSTGDLPALPSRPARPSRLSRSSSGRALPLPPPHASSDSTTTSTTTSTTSTTTNDSTTTSTTTNNSTTTSTNDSTTTPITSTEATEATESTSPPADSDTDASAAAPANAVAAADATAAAPANAVAAADAPPILTSPILDSTTASLPHPSAVFSPTFATNSSIITSEDGTTLKAASVYTIVKNMTGGSGEVSGRFTSDVAPNVHMIDYKELFLVYRSFITPMAMARLLALRLEDPTLPPFSPVLTKTAHVLRYWIKLEYERAFAADDALCAVIRDIGTRILPAKGVETLGSQLIRQIECGEEELALKRRIASMTEQEMEDASFSGDQDVIDYAHKQVVEKSRLERIAPDPLIAPGDLRGDFNLTFIPAVELARQLTLMEHDLFSAIDVRAECLGQMWTKKDNPDAAPNVKRLIAQFNIISQFVCASVMAKDAIEDRASEITHFIEVAAACRQLNNFNGVMEILAGLQFSELFRLQMTWDRVPERKMKIFYDLKELMSRDKNMKSPRAALAACTPPAVPYLGMYLTDLTFIEDGNSNQTGPDSLVNYEKRRMLASVVADVCKYQSVSYDLIPVPEIIQWLMREPDVPYDENILYQRSLELEPRSVLKEFRAQKEAEAAAASKNKTVMRFVDRLKKKKKSDGADNDDGADNGSSGSGGDGESDDEDDLMYYVATSRTRTSSNAAADDAGPSSSARKSRRDTSVMAKIDSDLVTSLIVGREPDDDVLVFDKELPPMKDGTPFIREATLHQLLRELTSFSKARAEPEVQAAFLATYTQFTTPREVLSELRKLFHWPTPPELEQIGDDVLIEAWKSKVLTPTRQRIFLFLSTWKKDRYDDFRKYEGAEEDLDTFTKVDISPVFSAGAYQLLQTKGRKRNKSRRRRAGSVASFAPPELSEDVEWARSNGTIILKVQNSVKVKATMMSPLELARQLTLLTWSCYDFISEPELMALGVAGSLISTVRITEFLQSFSAISNFIATEVIRGLTLKDRIELLEFMLEVAEHLLELQNFDSLVAVMRGLLCPSIDAQLWANLSVAGLDRSERLKDLASGNDGFVALSAVVASASPPAIPYMGSIFLGIKSQQATPTTSPMGRIAFGKFFSIHTHLSTFSKFKPSVFAITPVPFVQDWIKGYKAFPQERRIQVTELRRTKRAEASASS